MANLIRGFLVLILPSTFVEDIHLTLEVFVISTKNALRLFTFPRTIVVVLVVAVIGLLLIFMVSLFVPFELGLKFDFSAHIAG